MKASFKYGVQLHKAFFERNCTTGGCAKGYDQNASPEKWFSTDDNVFKSAITGEPCPENIAYNPYNYVGTYREELFRIKSLLKCTAAFAYLRYTSEAFHT